VAIEAKAANPIGPPQWAATMGIGWKMASANNFKAHEATYSSFLGLLKFSIPVITVLTIVVVALIA
jgi:hypothetical protein